MMATAVQDVTDTTSLPRVVSAPRAVRATPLGTPGASATFALAQGTLHVLEGQPAGWLAVGLGTMLRAGLIAGGFYLTGTRAWKPLLFGSLAASSVVTVVLFAGHAVLRKSQ